MATAICQTTIPSNSPHQPSGTNANPVNTNAATTPTASPLHTARRTDGMGSEKAEDSMIAVPTAAPTGAATNWVRAATAWATAYPAPHSIAMPHTRVRGHPHILAHGTTTHAANSSPG